MYMYQCCQFNVEGLGWLRGSSMGVCEAHCDMLTCKKGYTNTFDLMCTRAMVLNPGPQIPTVLHVLDVSLLQHT